MGMGSQEDFARELHFMYCLQNISWRIKSTSGGLNEDQSSLDERR
jgi:hypothetical protein